MLLIDHKYVGFISNRLERFTRLNPKTYNFRCPLCGDSKRNSYKTRGYIYEKKDRMLYFCHNCGTSTTFGNFLKQQDANLYTEYVQEKYLDKQADTEISTPDITKIVYPPYRFNSPLRDLKKISQLDHNHPAKKYVMMRKLPAKTHHKLFYAPRFKAWINSIIPRKFEVEDGDEPRLIIPFIDKDGYCYGIQGRSFRKTGIRYITIMFDEDKPKLFGLDTVDFDKPVFVVEGPLDSLFVENCIAMAGSDVSVDLIPSNNITFVYDNEPRNLQIVSKMEKVIKAGHGIVIWPDGIVQKDINDMVLDGINAQKLISSNIYKNLGAEMKLMQWKRI
jgi:transcription elongation factor Elf1